MCGIIAYFSRSEPIEQKKLYAMRDTQYMRGLDGFDSVFFNNNNVALGHHRLAIIDLSPQGAQPMSNEDGTVWLTFSGEIYNHAELSEKLKDLGHIYKSKCDAENIIHAWEEWGSYAVHHLRGIFSFVIWDSLTDTVFAARDHAGVKPLYYRVHDDSLILASQPRAFIDDIGGEGKINKDAFIDYLYFGVIPDENSIFKNVYKLPPGHSLTLKDKRLTIEKYWSYNYKPSIDDPKEAQFELTRALEDAVVSQMMSDVPFGTFLSGGIDSSIITAIASKKSVEAIPSISIGFKEKRHNELPFAREVASHCKTKEYVSILKRSHIFELIDEMADVHDEPYGLGASLPLMHISKFTRSCGLKVMLAGDGADELFAGYHHYDEININSDRYHAYRPHECLIHEKQEIKMAGAKLNIDGHKNPGWRYNKFIGHTEDPVLNAQILDFNTYLPDEILMKVDRASMAHGIEVRVPFLDQNLVELTSRIDHKLIYQSGNRKALLKNAASNWLPQHVLTGRKKGFSIPLRRWTAHPLIRLKMFNTLKHGVLREYGLLGESAFKRYGIMMETNWLWKFYAAEVWARRWAS